MTKKELKDMKAQLDELQKKYNKLVSETDKNAKKNVPEWKNVKQNIVKDGDGNPKAYALVQKQGRKKRVVMGSYARILKKNLKGEQKTEAEGWISTEVEVKGKTEPAFYVPMRKGHLTLDNSQVKELLNGF